MIAYMDASGSHDGSHNLVIAGYWGTASAWRQLERKWSSVIASQDGVAEFHAKEFWPRPNGKRIGPYKDWSDIRHSEFIGSLLNVIEPTSIHPFGFGVLASAWDGFPDKHKSHFSASANSKELNPKFIAFYTVVFRLLHYCRPPMRMHFVFDVDPHNAAFSEILNDLGRCIKHFNPEMVARMGQLTVKESRRALPLQAADLLAYECHRYCKAAKGNKQHPPRAEYIRALRRYRSRDGFWLFDDDRLEVVTKMFDDIDRLLEGGNA